MNKRQSDELLESSSLFLSLIFSLKIFEPRATIENDKKMNLVKQQGNSFILFKGAQQIRENQKFLSFLHVSIKTENTKKEKEKMSEQTQMQQEAPKHGTFCWMELSSTNVEPCLKFYSDLFGWNVTKSDSIPGFEYNEFGVGKERLGGMFQMSDECTGIQNTENQKSHWMSYVAVDNVDDTASRVIDLGGAVQVPPMDIPNVGRFSVVQDPSGAVISIITLK